MSSPAVSIITARADGSEHRLLETYQVLLRAQTAWEWLIQIDGPARDGSLGAGRSVADALLSDERVLVEINGLALGIAATRNRALACASAPLPLNADSDDVPTAAALDRLAPAFADPRVGLAFGDWIEHWPDRDPWIPTPRFAPGRLEAGTLSHLQRRAVGAAASGRGDVAYRRGAGGRRMERHRRWL